ncbi:hypothetical protein ABIC83_002522 [Roseateles asaccharophilus]|uniref:hypothetical protein n=1 Tax=Roseateles asaccharophilus TaxID=582607 RepID=UPI00383302FD
MLNGFFVPPDNEAGYTLAQLCLHHRNMDALRAVLENAPNGITYADVCNYACNAGGTVLFENSINFGTAAFEYLSSDALRVIADFSPGTPELRAIEKGLGGQTLHLHVLDKLVRNETTAAGAQGFAEFCQTLLDLNAPAKSKDKSTSAGSILFGRRWHTYEHSEVIDRLARAYTKSGSISLDHPAGMSTPLCELAIRTGNGLAAAIAIEMGCDLKASTPVEHEDLISFARSALVIDDTKSLVGLVTQALMNRHTSEAVTSTPVFASSPHQPDRRGMRASI